MALSMNHNILTSKKFGVLFDTFWKKLYLSSYKLTNNKNLSEDLVQETFMALWQSRNDFDSIKNVDNYLFGVLRNKIFEAYRKKKFDTVFLDNQFDAFIQNDPTENESAELQTKIDNLIDLLPEKRKKIFVMSRFHEKSHEEIAQELNISTQTVKNQVTASLQFLRNNLKNELLIFVITSEIICVTV
jgi:RNA polymerase sigma-70 factor (family 1)